MGRLMLGNLEPGTTDDEIRDFLVKYGFPPFDEIAHEPGDGTRPAVLLTFTSIDPTTLFNLRERVHDLFWKNRKLTARILQDRFA
jgi:RNA recognition motif-containing protein